MATKPKEIEAHILLGVGYNEYVAIPASLASSVLPVVRQITRTYANGDYVYELANKHTEVILLDADRMAAAYMVGKLKGESNE